MAEPEAIVQRVAAGLGLGIERRLAGGEWGAYLARTARGQGVVLKLPVPHPRLSLEWVSSAVELATALRQDGYPIPRYLDVGEMHGRVFTVQEAIRGEVPDRLRPSHVRQLIEFWYRQEGAAEQVGMSGERWRAHVVEGLRTGSEIVYIDHKVLRECGDERVARVLDAAVAIGERADPSMFRTGDVVHSDLHHRNLLVRGDEVVAVFDWEGAHAGDSRVDLIGLAAIPALHHADPAAATALIQAELTATVPPELHAAVTALGILQDLTFAVRTKPDALETVLKSAQALLRD